MGRITCAGNKKQQGTKACDKMCLAVPGKVVELKDRGLTAIVDYGSEKRPASNAVERAKAGDWVLVQFGAVADTLAEEDAQEMLKGWKEGQKT
ncbi:MAG: HypC/HybG/HupF family hydrogenase formation chaperone [Candidatus Micrarchaeota archaeon]